jgi:HSP20 family molecular chaperone IbpA
MNDDVTQFMGVLQEMLKPLIDENRSDMAQKMNEKRKVNGLINVVEQKNGIAIFVTAIGFDKHQLYIEASENENKEILIRIKNRELNEEQKQINDMLSQIKFGSFDLDDFKLNAEILISNRYDIEKINVKFLNGLIIIGVGKYNQNGKRVKKISIE